MEYTFKLSLERMALTTVAVALWDHQHDVMAPTAMQQPSMSLLTKIIVWEKAEDKVIENVTCLLLPKPLKQKLLEFISGVGLEMFKWKEHLYQEYSLDIILPRDICWTPHQTVDAKRTAEKLVIKEDIDITRRYRLACHYCLEDDIPKLWEKIPENLREQFNSNMEQDYLVVLWTHRIKGEVEKLDDEIQRRWGVSERSPYQHAFDCAARSGNKAAIEYFLQKMTHEEREVALGTSAKLVAYFAGSHIDLDSPNLSAFLFSQMDEWEQIEVFKNDSYHLLCSLLHWPWQSVFMETINRTWDFLPNYCFHRLLKTIAIKIKNDFYKDCDYSTLFGKVLQQSPNAHKEYVILELRGGLNFILSDLLLKEEEENVRLILKCAAVEERKKIISHSNVYSIHNRLVIARKWNSVKIFLEECLSSKEIMIEFKEEFRRKVAGEMFNRFSSNYEIKMEEVWNKFFQILDDLIQDK